MGIKILNGIRASGRSRVRNQKRKKKEIGQNDPWCFKKNRCGQTASALVIRTLYEGLTCSRFWFGRVPIWYVVKVAFVAWLVLPQFKGATFIYEKFVREQLMRYGGRGKDHDSPKGKEKS